MVYLFFDDCLCALGGLLWPDRACVLTFWRLLGLGGSGFFGGCLEALLGGSLGASVVRTKGASCVLTS